MAEIRKVQTITEGPVKKKRVAAYARVSMETDGLLHSLSNQISYYSTLIQNNSEWEYAGVYADGGISGTSTEQRDEFNRLIRDCEAGRIDLVLTKSVSRFARNTVDLLEAVRHLKEIGVEVYFEEQHLTSMSSDGEMMLTILGAVAQEEAETIRDNAEWVIRKRFEQGIPYVHKRFLGYKWDGEKYIVIPEEAEIVRRIFRMYLEGKSMIQIERALSVDGLTNINGAPISQSNIRFILGNENYTGNLLLQKRYSPGIRKRAVNRGQVPMYRVEEDHEPVIDRETFEKVQELRKKRAPKMPEREDTCFSGLLKCGYCGHCLVRKNRSKPEAKISWVCNTFDKKGPDACECRRWLPEDELITATKELLGDHYEEKIRRDIKEITVYDDRIEFHGFDEKTRTWTRHFSSDPDSRGCFSRKIYCGKCGAPFLRESSRKKHYAVWMCRNRRSDKKSCDCRLIRESDLHWAMERIIGEADDVEMKFHCETEKVLVFDDRLEFFMKDGEVKTWQRK